MAIDPRGKDLKAFLQAAPDEPVVMLNLLRFVPGGRGQYEDYLRHFRVHAESRGAQVLYYGTGDSPLVAEPGQSWDAVLLVRYPTRRSFSEMVADPDYQAGASLRAGALVEAVLQPTVPADV
ncbi:DUF1330 domain-containing protein [Nocardioides deserti]|uniref:DUF1330 domain-containing protein n=1 Tax=Nocardioides deserti TaxID=1588644 RepID=A0ABR6UAE5_9ACTN|nr:DUF1330 domain-containing protein [Nocardioides deserti]MBC2961414.1 DUF1330 domain-containing protein [Nocardioides deserti]GGO72687.1 hypothetical protein GCM10012276_16630 [Nocardioides deserti]